MQHYPYTFDEKRVCGWIEKIRNGTRFLVSDCGLCA